MSVFGHRGVQAAVAAMAIGIAAIPATYAHDALFAASLSTANVPVSAEDAREAILTAEPAPIVAEAEETFDPTANLDPQLECMAKVVHHEAANQTFEGQVAVAQIILNRVESPKFPDTPCEVVHQRGQFFDTTRYNPSRASKTWASAVEAALEALANDTRDHTRGAYFYHAAYQPATPFFRTRTRVLQLGDHIFYR